jgi:glycerophosphoryl diester phosphodiesterase
MHPARTKLCVLAVLALCLISSPAAGESSRRSPARSQVPTPIVIGHRGASGYVPEHTLASYFIAIQQGADFVEPDLVSTKDHVLVARHEPEIGGTTDVADHPEFANRRRMLVIDGVSTTGWFTSDFTLAELKTLRAKERIPENRPANARFDGQFEIPTFEEVIALVRSANIERVRRALASGQRPPKPIGIYPETKHPTFFDGLGLSLEEPLLRSLRRNGYFGKDAPVFIQSFETANLRELSKVTELPLVQLLDATGKPFDFVVANDPRTYADLASGPGLAWIARYADGVGPNKNLVIPRNADQTLGFPSNLVRDAHRVGLLVHIFTIRAENPFLPAELRNGTDPTLFGDVAGEIRRFLDVGIDGFFNDQPILGMRARDAFVGAP